MSHRTHTHLEQYPRYQSTKHCLINSLNSVINLYRPTYLPISSHRELSVWVTWRSDPVSNLDRRSPVNHRSRRKWVEDNVFALLHYIVQSTLVTTTSVTTKLRLQQPKIPCPGQLSSYLLTLWELRLQQTSVITTKICRSLHCCCNERRLYSSTLCCLLAQDLDNLHKAFLEWRTLPTALIPNSISTQVWLRFWTSEQASRTSSTRNSWQQTRIATLSIIAASTTTLKWSSMHCT